MVSVAQVANQGAAAQAEKRLDGGTVPCTGFQRRVSGRSGVPVFDGVACATDFIARRCLQQGKCGHAVDYTAPPNSRTMPLTWGGTAAGLFPASRSWT